MAVGSSDPQVGETVSSLFSFLDQSAQVVAARTADSCKYVCNAFHATKAPFAKETSWQLRIVCVDSREVMALPCEDHVPNVSPAYLRPAFAFGGTFLSRDLRSLLHLAHEERGMPMLVGAPAMKKMTIGDIVDRLVACDGRTVALLGLSYKANTDDLGESSNAELAERLIGKGFNVRIYDPVVNPARLIGVNRCHMEAKLSHLGRLLTQEPSDSLRAGLLEAPPCHPLDMNGRLGPDIESPAGYKGIGS